MGRRRRPVGDSTDGAVTVHPLPDEPQDLLEATRDIFDKMGMEDIIDELAEYDGVLTIQNANQEFTDAILKNQSITSLMKLLQLIGYRSYLAGDDAA